MEISSCHLHLSQYLPIAPSHFACYTTVPHSPVARLLLFYNAWLSSSVWATVNLPSFRTRTQVRNSSALSVFKFGSNHRPRVEHTALTVLTDSPNYTHSVDKTNFFFSIILLCLGLSEPYIIFTLWHFLLFCFWVITDTFNYSHMLKLQQKKKHAKFLV